MDPTLVLHPPITYTLKLIKHPCGLLPLHAQLTLNPYLGGGGGGVVRVSNPLPSTRKGPPPPPPPPGGGGVWFWGGFSTPPPPPPRGPPPPPPLWVFGFFSVSDFSGSSCSCKSLGKSNLITQSFKVRVDRVSDKIGQHNDQSGPNANYLITW
ncbi:hypothetical protein Hanom_Chr03g00247381 [Helianthus anomalus]